MRATPEPDATRGQNMCTTRTPIEYYIVTTPYPLGIANFNFLDLLILLLYSFISQFKESHCHALTECAGDVLEAGSIALGAALMPVGNRTDQREVAQISDCVLLSVDDH